MKPSTLIAVSKWMWCLYPCSAQGPVDINNAMRDVYAWIATIRKKNASSPSKTETLYAVLATLSPWEPTAIKIKAWTNFANGIV